MVQALPLQQTHNAIDKRSEFLVKREIARNLCKTSPFYLGKYILGYDRFCDSQVNWDKWVCGNIDLTGHKPGKFLILQPRETFKTTYFDITLVICLLLNNPELSIAICNERHENAKDILKEIKRHFEANEKLRTLFGDYVSKDGWAEHAITISKKTKNVKEPSIWITGIGSAVTSKHPDVIVCDDIAGSKDKESEAGRAQTFSFFQDLWDLLKKDSGIFIGIGTRKHINDIYSHIKKNLNLHLEKAGLQTFKVLETPAHKDGNPESDVLNFPSILTHDKLRELRIVKEDKDGVDYSTFMAEYELNPLDPKSQIFKTFHYVNINGLKYTKLSQWTDPAMGEKKDSDFSAIIVIAQIAEGEHKGKRVVLYASIEKRPPTKVIDDHNRIYRMLHALYPDIDYQVNMEENGFQGLKDYSREKSLNDGGEPVPTRGRSNTEKKEIRIESLEPAISTGMLMFREDWLDAPENYRLLIEQFKNYPQAKKDGPDATQGAWKHIMRSGPQVR